MPPLPRSRSCFSPGSHFFPSCLVVRRRACFALRRARAFPNTAASGFSLHHVPSLRPFNNASPAWPVLERSRTLAHACVGACMFKRCLFVCLYVAQKEKDAPSMRRPVRARSHLRCFSRRCRCYPFSLTASILHPHFLPSILCPSRSPPPAASFLCTR